jgi:uncharacterized protein with GYD domain
MVTYISLINLKSQGKGIKNASEHLRTLENLVGEAGGRLIGFYLVMGQYDYVTVIEAPDDQTAARLILTMWQDDAHTESLRAFPREEFESMVRGL